MRKQSVVLAAGVAVLVASGCCKRPEEGGALKDTGGNDRPGSAGPATPPGQIPEIPAGTSAPPSVAEWEAGHPVNTQGANAIPSNCSMKVVREWLKVNCSGKIREITNMEGFGRKGVDYFESVVPGKHADFVVRLRKGSALKMRILRDGPHSASLFVNWPAGNPRPSIIALGIFNG
ncbi:MAG: hypothetical protein MUF64_24160 [Polyangiaceae bacterium]|jgi:hypothetical protein|nr:hypothetical protein [Polyangiaceae bacterium]